MKYVVTIVLAGIMVIGTSVQEFITGGCPVDFEGYLTPRLQLNEQARVAFDIQLNIRPEPSLAEARINTLDGGQQFIVVDGPACADKFVWWQIEQNDVTGWVAEGSINDDEYFIEPRGERIIIENDENKKEVFIQTATGFIEPEGCAAPPEDYEQVQLGFATLNQRTLFMLDNAQRIYDADGGTRINFRFLITQGSYNAGGVAASFGTHDGGGAVDISVIDTSDGWIIMRDEIPAMLRALRIAGFAAWLRDTDELYDGSIIHIHAIAIGDAEGSEIAMQQVDSEFGYFSGYNGLPPAEGDDPVPDIYGDPVLCEWMVKAGFEDRSD